MEKIDIIETLVNGEVVKSYIIKYYYKDDKLIRIEYRNSDYEIHRDEDLPAIISYNPMGNKRLSNEGRHEIWVQNGKMYRANDKPNIVVYYPDSNIVYSECWKNNDILHRDNDEPAVIRYYRNGNIENKSWFYNREYHRDNDKPACIEYYENGQVKKEEWYLKGELDRPFKGKPAKIRYYSDSTPKEKIWYKNGIVTRDDGPAHILYYFNFRIESETWYVDGIIKSEEGEPDTIIYDPSGDGTIKQCYKNGAEFRYPDRDLLDDINNDIKTRSLESLQKIRKILELID